jgi:hypothetical protein
MKAYTGSRGMTPFILNLALYAGEWLPSRSGRFTPGKEQLHRRLGGPQNQCGCFGEEKNLLKLSGFEPRTVQPAAQFLYRLPELHTKHENVLWAKCGIFGS